MTQKNDFRNQKFVSGLVATAIKSAMTAEQDVKIALANCIKMAADNNVGRFNEMNKLWTDVPNGMRENIRLWFVNLIRETGVTVTGENGKERLVGFFKFNKEKLWHHPEQKTDVTKEHRAKIEAMSIEDLMEIPLGPVSRDTVEEQAEKGLEDFEAAISRILKTYTANNVLTPAMVERFNGLLSETKRVDIKAIEAAKKKQVENAMKVLERNKVASSTNDNVITIELPEPVARTGTNA